MNPSTEIELRGESEGRDDSHAPSFAGVVALIAVGAAVIYFSKDKFANFWRMAGGLLVIVGVGMFIADALRLFS